MTLKQNFLLHSDNIREFCNSSIRSMVVEFQVRHIRGRPRCPWIQYQVERANKTIKWIIGSTLLSLNAPVKWCEIRQSATYLYNHIRHFTTSDTPFILLFGSLIRDLKHEDYLNLMEEVEIAFNDEGKA